MKLPENFRVEFLFLLILLAPFAASGSFAETAADATGDPLLVPLACFAPGTPASVVEAHATRRSWQLLTSLREPSGDRHQFADGNRWTRTATDGSGLGQGDPTTLTWSVVPDGLSITGYGGEATSPSNLRAFLDSTYGSSAVWIPLLQGVFDRWSELTGLRYVYESSDDGATFPTGEGVLGVRGDVRLAGHAIDGTSGVLAYNFYPNLGDMVLDTADGVLQNTNNNSLVLRNVLSHEHGHGIGIPHVCPVNQTKLMEPYLTTAFDGPQHDDIVAANRGYGDRYEDSDTPGTATPIGSAPAAVVLDDLSADDPGEPDYFRFTVGSNSSVTVSVAPIGNSYLSGAQSSGGACSQGNLIDTSSLQDLSVEILDRDGTTVLAAADANGPGVGELLEGIGLDSGAGSYFALVRGSGQDDAQLYRLEIDLSDPQPTPEHTLTVSTAGDGSGSIVSTPAGIDCGADCSQNWNEGTTVELDTLPDAGSVFAGWSGAADCSDGVVTMMTDLTCTATFSVDPGESENFTLTVARSGNGQGTVTSNPTGIQCGSDCSEIFPDGTLVSLDASPSTGSVFSQWTGHADCADGLVTMVAARSCTAVFDLAPTQPEYRLTVSLTGNGGGSVTSTPAGIACGNDCSHDYARGTRVTLAAQASPGSVFKRFRGDASCRDGVVLLNSDVSCTAQFARSKRLSIKISGTGGTLRSAPEGLDCRQDCDVDFEEGVTIDLLAVPDPGWELYEWRGHPDCRDGQVTLRSNRHCHAVFVETGETANYVFQDGFESGTLDWWGIDP